MIGIITGKCIKAGEGQYGPWYVIAETVTKKDGGRFDVRYMCGGNEAVAIGEVVTVTGTAISGVREHDGKHYADTKLSFCTVIRHGEREDAPSGGETFEEDIPFS